MMWNGKRTFGDKLSFCMQCSALMIYRRSADGGKI